MNLHDILQSIGINPTVLYAGALGGVLRALSRQKFKLREIVAAPICGALASAYLTLPAVHYVKATGWPMPPEETPVVLASAFLIGKSAMWITDIVFELIVRRIKPADPD